MNGALKYLIIISKFITKFNLIVLLLKERLQNIKIKAASSSYQFSVYFILYDTIIVGYIQQIIFFVVSFENSKFSTWSVKCRWHRPVSRKCVKLEWIITFTKFSLKFILHGIEGIRKHSKGMCNSLGNYKVYIWIFYHLKRVTNTVLRKLLYAWKFSRNLMCLENFDLICDYIANDVNPNGVRLCETK